MKDYFVSIYFSASACLAIEANSKEEAEKKADKTLDDYLEKSGEICFSILEYDEVSIHEHINNQENEK